MKVLIILLAVILNGRGDNIHKYTKVTCSSSGILCPNATCRVKAVSRYNSILTFSCNLTKTLKNGIEFSFKSSFRNFEGGNYRQIINLPKLDACRILNAIEMFPQFKEGLEFLKTAYNGLIHKCPYNKGMVKVNASLMTTEQWKDLGVFNAPTGYWLNQIRISNKQDDKILELNAFIEYRSPQDLNDKF